MRTISIIIASTLIMCTTSWAQKGLLLGKVMAQSSKEPILGVYVIKNVENGVITDFDGSYKLELESGEHKITYQYIGYSSQDKIVHISPGDTINLSVFLEEQKVILKNMYVMPYYKPD